MSIDDRIGQTIEETARSQQATRKVWDLPVRVFHWSLALAFIGAYVSNRAGIEYFTLHLWCGYAVIVLVAFRIVWGLVGTRHARFWNFVRGPVSTWRYARATLRNREQHTPGHNPLGALMVIALLASLLVQSVFGLFTNDEIFNVGPLYGYVSDALALKLTSWHRQLFYWIAAAVALHVIAVLVHVALKKDKLVRAMVTGRKPAVQIAPRDEIRSSRWWLALVIVLALSALLAWIVLHAPQGSSGELY